MEILYTGRSEYFNGMTQKQSETTGHVLKQAGQSGCKAKRISMTDSLSFDRSRYITDKSFLWIYVCYTDIFPVSFSCFENSSFFVYVIYIL